MFIIDSYNIFHKKEPLKVRQNLTFRGSTSFSDDCYLCGKVVE